MDISYIYINQTSWLKSGIRFYLIMKYVLVAYINVNSLNTVTCVIEFYNTYHGEVDFYNVIGFDLSTYVHK